MCCASCRVAMDSHAMCRAGALMKVLVAERSFNKDWLIMIWISVIFSQNSRIFVCRNHLHRIIQPIKCWKNKSAKHRPIGGPMLRWQIMTLSRIPRVREPSERSGSIHGSPYKCEEKEFHYKIHTSFSSFTEKCKVESCRITWMYFWVCILFEHKNFLKVFATSLCPSSAQVNPIPPQEKHPLQSFFTVFSLLAVEMLL